MTAAMVDRQGRYMFSSSTCTACGVVLEYFADRGADSRCSRCGTELCSSCYDIKQKLELPSADRHIGRYCVACKQVIAIKKGDELRNETKQGELTNVIGMPQVRQGKDHRLSHGKSANDLFTETVSRDRYFSNKGELGSSSKTSFANEGRLETYSPVTQTREELEFTDTRFWVKRNERGLVSKSNVPNAIDNRYYYLNGSEMFKDERLNSMENVDRRNFYAGKTSEKNRNSPLSHEFKQLSESDRPHKFHRRVENKDDFDRDKELADTMFKGRPGTNHSHNHTNKFEHDMLTGSPDINQRSSQSRNTADQFMQNVSNRRTHDLPPDSQFYSETIKYPASSARYPFTHHRQTANIRYDQGLSGYTDSNNQHGKHTCNQMSSHTARPIASGSHSSPSGLDEYFDDPYFDTEDNLDDLDDVPAYDDIPFALLITGSIDEKTLIRAKRKQQQQLAFDIIKGQSGNTKAVEKINKNKNQGLNVAKDRDNTRDTYRELITAHGKKSSVDAAQNEVKSHVGHTYQATEHRKENPPREKTRYTTKHSEPRLHDITSEQDVTSPTKGTIPKTFDDKNKYVTFEDEPKKNNMEFTEFSGQDRKLARSRSPVEISNDETEITQTRALTAKEHDKQLNKDRQAVQDFHEMLPHTDRKAGNFIREKRLEKLKSKASEINKTNMTSDVKRKPDNRDVAFNVDAVHKPVKSTAFRSKTLFLSDKTLHQHTTDSSETSKHGTGTTNTSESEMTIPNPQDVSTRNDLQLSSSPDRQPTTTKYFKKETAADRTQSQRKFEAITPASTSAAGKRTESNAKLKKSDMPDMQDEKEVRTTQGELPSVMKLLIKQKQQNRKKQMENVDKSQPSSKSSTDSSEEENLVEPVAMRLLRESKQAKERQKSVKRIGIFSQGGAKSSGDFASLLLSTMFGFAPPETSSTENKRIIPSDRAITATKTKPMIKNKNKNQSPLKQRVNNYSDMETEIVESNRNPLAEDDSEKQSGTGMKTEKESQIVLLSFTPQKPSAASKQTADNRHRAFQKLKISESASRLKCTSCGRPECKSHNIQKMKEIIRMAKQAGFDVRDVTPDGNCMFAAVVDQLQLYCDFRFGPKSLREAAVTWLIEHPLSDDGTHYSSFVAENWDIYLQRMMAEGEWGDHVVLRAVVETVGHTIKILNISGDESHWTILEPKSIDATKDGMHLVLGHVGEFHYTSLRPADGNSSFVPASPSSPVVQDPLMTNDNGQIALEDTETLEMFREDYIDEWSDMPTVHFSYLLKHVIPVKVVDKAAIFQSQYIDSFTGANKLKISSDGALRETTEEYGGSVVEGVYVPALHTLVSEGTDMPKKNYIVTFVVFKDIRVVEKQSQVASSGGGDCVIDTTGVHIGYTKILLTQRFPRGTEEYSMYMPHPRMRDVPETSQYVCAILCPFWPECAHSWKSRVRREGFPSVDIISSIESEGCLLVPTSHKDSKSPNNEWKFSFSLCEKKLFRDALSIYQKYCFILFDALCTQTMAHLESISLEHLKSVFFFACERIPAEYWESSPGACVLYMLDELLRYVRSKSLPNYFVRANNMIDHLREKDFKEIEEQIILLRSQPVLFLRQINEHLLMLPHGDLIIDKVSEDFRYFKTHRSLKQSTLEIFVPTTINVAHDCIKKRKYAEGYEMVLQAFQQRLSVSTCDDSVPFQIFLPGAVSGLDLDSLVWFSAYTDKQLEGQLSKSLIRETCGDLSLAKIKDVLSADIVGSYGNTEVPVEHLRRVCSFCYEFARFLYQTDKLSEILPILYRCHDDFTKKQENTSLLHAHEKGGIEEQPELNDFDDESMYYIYTAMFHVYYRQGQMEFFRSMVPYVDTLVKRIHAHWAYDCLGFMYETLNDTDNAEKCRNIRSRLPSSLTDNMHVATFNSWFMPSDNYAPQGRHFTSKVYT